MKIREASACNELEVRKKDQKELCYVGCRPKVTDKSGEAVDALFNVEIKESLAAVAGRTV